MKKEFIISISIVSVLLLITCFCIFGNFDKKKGSYQIKYTTYDSITVYDGSRYVGTVKTNWNSSLDSLIEYDNQ